LFNTLNSNSDTTLGTHATTDHRSASTMYRIKRLLQR
jgi:hypothetical protein